MRRATLWTAVLLAVASPWAAGETVYRCGSSYSQQPCAGGTAIETPDPPSPADRAQAANAAAADARRADALERARLAREKEAPKAVIPPSPPVRPEPPKARGGKPEQFTAASPGAPGKGKKKKKPAAGKGE